MKENKFTVQDLIDMGYKPISIKSCKGEETIEESMELGSLYDEVVNHFNTNEHVLVQPDIEHKQIRLVLHELHIKDPDNPNSWDTYTDTFISYCLVRPMTEADFLEDCLNHHYTGNS